MLGGSIQRETVPRPPERRKTVKPHRRFPGAPVFRLYGCPGEAPIGAASQQVFTAERKIPNILGSNILGDTATSADEVAGSRRQEFA